MSKKPDGDVPMTPLNVDVPAELMDRIKLAKIVVKKSIRQITADALEAWLRANGITQIPKPKK
jgi:hypothetical protein